MNTTFTSENMRERTKLLFTVGAFREGEPKVSPTVQTQTDPLWVLATFRSISHLPRMAISAPETSRIICAQSSARLKLRSVYRNAPVTRESELSDSVLPYVNFCGVTGGGSGSSKATRSGVVMDQA